MALNSSGPISLGGATTGQSINLELGQPAVTLVSLNDPNVRSLAGVPSGTISMPTDFWGKSSFTGWILTYTYNVDSTTTITSQGLSYDYTNNIAYFNGLNFASTGTTRRGYFSSYNVLTGTYNFQRGYQSNGSLSGIFTYSAWATMNSTGRPAISLNNGVIFSRQTVQRSDNTVAGLTGIMSTINLTTGNVINFDNSFTYGQPSAVWTRNIMAPVAYARPIYGTLGTGGGGSGFTTWPSNNSSTTAMTSQGYVYGNNNYRFGDGESSRENSTGNFYFCGSSRTAASTTRRPGILKTNSAGAGIVSKVFTNGQNSQICYGNYNNAQNKLAIGMLMAAANSSIALMDSNLNFIGANALTLTNTNLNVQSVYLDDDGSIYVLSTNAALFPNLQFLTKFDSSFNEIWQRTFDNQGGAQIDYVDSEAIYIYKPQIMQTAAGNISYPWLWKLPKDGGKTGTYTIGGVSVTYAVSTSATFTVGANPITIENGAVVTTLASNAATSNSNGYNATASAGTNVFRPTI